MYDCIHLSTSKPRREILGVEIPGELISDTTLLDDPRVGCGKLPPKKWIRPASQVISVSKLRARLQESRRNGARKTYAPLLSVADQTGYEYLVVLR